MFTHELKLYMAKLAIPVLLIGGVVLVANMASSQTECSREEAAAGLCTPSTPLTVPTTPTTSGGSGMSPTTVAPAPPTTTAQVPTTVQTITPTTVAIAPAPTMTSTTVAPAPPTTVPVPSNVLTVTVIQPFCQPACDASRFEVLENGGAVHLKAGSTILVNLPAGYCADTPAAREVGPSQFSVNEMTIRRCGGIKATVAPAASTVAPATAGAPCAIPGAGWMTNGGNSWVSDGSVVFNCVVPQGFLVDTPSGRKGPGSLLSTSQATAYQLG